MSSDYFYSEWPPTLLAARAQLRRYVRAANQVADLMASQLATLTREIEAERAQFDRVFAS